VWTPQAYAQMQRIYVTLAVHARIYAKRAIMERATASQGKRRRPLTAADIRRAWSEARAATGL
jgi:hypothetical protein